MFIWLKLGIEIKSLKIDNYNVEGLYIKLDKKLILKADSITIPKSKEDPTFNNIPEILERVKYRLTFFESIALKKIIFDNNTFSILFRDDLFRINSKKYEIRGNVRREGKMLKATIPHLFIKEHNVTIEGEFLYDLHEEILETEGTVVFNRIKGNFNVVKNADEIDFSLSSDRFSDLISLLEKFTLKERTKHWIVDRVVAESYQLHSLTGKGSIVNKAFKLDIDSLEGNATLHNAKVYFKKELEPALAKNIVLKYENGGLFFTLDTATYKQRSLEGSRVAIEHLAGDLPTVLQLDLVIHSKIDAVLQEVLEAYKLNIPIYQEGEKAFIYLKLDEYLKEGDRPSEIDVNVDLGQGDLYIHKTKLPVMKGNISYENGDVTLANVALKEKWYEGSVSGVVHLKTKKAALLAEIKSLTIGEGKETFIRVKNRKFPLTLNYENHIEILIPKLSLSLKNDTNGTAIDLANLNMIKPYLANHSLFSDGGSVDIKTKDFETFLFQGVLQRSSCFLYEKEDQCKTRVPFEGRIAPKDVDFFAFDKRFYFNKSKSKVKLKDLNIDLEKFLTIKQHSSPTKEKVAEDPSLIIIGENSTLRYGEYRLITESYDVEVKGDGEIKAIGNASGDIIKFSQKRDIVSLQALRIKDKVLHPLINFKGLQGGRYSIKKSGNPQETMKGQVIVEGGVMKDFKAYNNTLAFINTIPALVALHEPGFSTQGFTIKEGIVEYRQIKKDKIVFDSVYINGSSATIVGKGEVDLKNKTINMNLAIQVAREVGSVLGNLPVLGYILMGKDKSATIGLKITGTLDKPEVTTSGAQEILLLPLDILKRTLETPVHILNK
ncbi:MAG: AsmA-like C-terminal domain-containing protein [Campylobacterota bacterium]|nr:AsmA-like C-terminal domain-containing protein [Campylobacterota bacterium]